MTVVALGMDFLTKISDRDVYFFHVTDKKFPADFFNEGTCLVVIADKELGELDWLATKASENDNILYVCSAGKLGQDIENSFDQTPRFLMTTKHESLEEAVWFATHVAFHDSRDIKRCIVVLLDRDGLGKEKIFQAARAVEDGWEPAD